MSNVDKDKKAASDAFEEVQNEIADIAKQAIKNYLLPLQTKKLSKKMIEQIALECGAQIASDAVKASRKASSRYAAKLTGPLNELLSIKNLPVSPVFNDKLASFAGKLTEEDIEKIKADQQKASQVVSRVYKSLFDFALEIGIKSFDNQTKPASAKQKPKN